MNAKVLLELELNSATTDLMLAIGTADKTTPAPAKVRPDALQVGSAPPSVPV
jgi:hypothetical protein